MNGILELVNTVCQTVREKNNNSTTFKKVISSTRKEFRSQDFDIKFKTKKNLELNPGQYYVLAFYDADDDFNNDTPIEVIIHHNFSDTDRFQNSQITDLLVQIFDAVVHEIRHQAQSRHRGYQTYSHHESEPYQKYLADPDELDAYALSRRARAGAANRGARRARRRHAGRALRDPAADRELLRDHDAPSLRAPGAAGNARGGVSGPAMTGTTRASRTGRIARRARLA